MEFRIHSTTALGGNATFTSPWFPMDQVGTPPVGNLIYVIARVFADQASAANGLKIQQSDDTANANFTETVSQVAVVASTYTVLRATISARNWRVTYTNGAVAQGSFEITSDASFTPFFNFDASGDLQVNVGGAGVSAVNIAQVNGNTVSTSGNGVQQIATTGGTQQSLYTEIAGQVTKANIKATPGSVFSAFISNANAAVRFFQLHNKASAPAAADVPLMSFPIPAGSANAPTCIAFGTDFFTDRGMAFGTGIGWAISTTYGTFTDAATATDHVAEVHFS